MTVARSGGRWTAPRRPGRALVGLAVAITALVAGTRGTQDAIANGDTRTLSFFHAHTKESATITFRRNGRYDSAALKQLNWLLRDWRVDEPTQMDPRLFDIVWEVYREVGAEEPVHVVSAFRSPGTNAMLARRSRAVSKHSQHMAGRAMDFSLPGVDMARVRAVAMRLQYGGVGYYPGGNAFVHLDTGSVRAWPRMTHDQLVRLFPDGKTVHIPSDGKPLARYAEARAEIMGRGGAVSGYASADAQEGGGRRRSLWASLFGGDDEDAAYYRGTQGRARVAARSGSSATASAPSARSTPSANSDDAGTRGLLALAAADQAPQMSPAPRPGSRSATTVAQAEPPPEPSTRVASLAPAPEQSSGLLDFFSQRPATAASPAAPTQPEEVREQPTVKLTPMPPRRPDDVVASDEPPLPPTRPVETAPAGAVLAASATSVGSGERAALRVLFAAAASDSIPVPTLRAAASRPASSAPIVAASLLVDPGPALKLGFSARPTGDLSASRFTGPAVKPLPVLR